MTNVFVIFLCSLLRLQIADLKLFNLLGGNNNAEFQQQRDEALASIDKAFSRSARLRELCGPAYDNVQSLGVSVRRLSIFNDVQCDVADDEMSTEFITIRPVDPNNGVAKLQFEGGVKQAHVLRILFDHCLYYIIDNVQLCHNSHSDTFRNIHSWNEFRNYCRCEWQFRLRVIYILSRRA